VSISIALVNRDVTVALFGGLLIISSHERRRLTISDAAEARSGRGPEEGAGWDNGQTFGVGTVGLDKPRLVLIWILG
jgi:hypothetical protein